MILYNTTNACGLLVNDTTNISYEKKGYREPSEYVRGQQFGSHFTRMLKSLRLSLGALDFFDKNKFFYFILIIFAFFFIFYFYQTS